MTSHLQPALERILGARVLGLTPIGRERDAEQSATKSHGYGRPLLVEYEREGHRARAVFRTMAADGFGHDRRADRLENLVLAQDSFGRIPRHVRALAVGVIDPHGQLASIPEGEPFLLTEYVEGELYARDLERAAPLAQPAPLDVARAEALARYLAALHAERAGGEQYVRSIRDTVGHGEGIFGLLDSYPAEVPSAPPGRLMTLERALVRWRWTLRGRVQRARRTHGDFHPFNLLFREGVDLSVLDASRGVAGDPADDVCCLSINYLFFALAAGHTHFEGALRALWSRFWSVYLEASGDHELLEVVAPFYTWRALVLCSPVWYPHVSPLLRDRLLGFAERLLDGAVFAPERIEELL